MNRIRTQKKIKHPTVALGILALAWVIPSAFALAVPFGPPKTAQKQMQVSPVQVAEDDDHSRLRHDDDDRAEHLRREEMEERAREKAHRFGERQEERAEHLRDKVNHERAEHERHEANEHEHGED